MVERERERQTDRQTDRDRDVKGVEGYEMGRRYPLPNRLQRLGSVMSSYILSIIYYFWSKEIEIVLDLIYY